MLGRCRSRARLLACLTRTRCLRVPAPRYVSDRRSPSDDTRKLLASAGASTTDLHRNRLVRMRGDVGRGDLPRRPVRCSACCARVAVGGATQDECVVNPPASADRHDSVYGVALRLGRQWSGLGLDDEWRVIRLSAQEMCRSQTDNPLGPSSVRIDKRERGRWRASGQTRDSRLQHGWPGSGVCLKHGSSVAGPCFWPELRPRRRNAADPEGCTKPGAWRVCGRL